MKVSVFYKSMKRVFLVTGLFAIGGLLAGCETPPQTEIISQTRRIIPEKPEIMRAQELVSLADQQMKAGHPAAYATNLEEARALVEKYPMYTVVTAKLANYYRSHGDEGKALPLYRELMDTKGASEGTDPNMLVEWAELELKYGDAQRAREGFERTASQAREWESGRVTWPRFGQGESELRANAHYVAGLKAQGTDQEDLAIQEYRTALQLSPKNAELKCLLAFNLEQRCTPPKGDEALALYKSIPAGSAAGPAAKKAVKRMQYYWNTWHSWNPIDETTMKPKAWDGKTGQYVAVPSK